MLNLCDIARTNHFRKNDIRRKKSFAGDGVILCNSDLTVHARIGTELPGWNVVYSKALAQTSRWYWAKSYHGFAF